MKRLLFKIVLFLAYSVFAGYSAWMTATSVQLKWMSQMPIWFVFIMIFIIALFAGWCLDNSIKELKVFFDIFDCFGFWAPGQE